MNKREKQFGPSMKKIRELLLDNDNPRLGISAGDFSSQSDILDYIVAFHGIDDVLSSIAVNGYFEAEPLVGQIRDSQITVKEGNRRLAACLIILGDERATNQKSKTEYYQNLWKTSGSKNIEEVPVIIADDEYDLLAYLGVRHISSARPWDSYAKARWVANILDAEDLSIEKISDMIGDRHQTVRKTLEGYYFVNQLKNVGLFDPSNSVRKGRGSNPEYPFSWVYTALGLAGIRKWVGLSELSAEIEKAPIQEGNLESAAKLMEFLFGNSSVPRNPAITDSREIGDLSKIVDSPELRLQLERGRSVSDLKKFLVKPSERVIRGLVDVKDILEDISLLFDKDMINSRDAVGLDALSREVLAIMKKIRDKIYTLVSGSTRED